MPTHEPLRRDHDGGGAIGESARIPGSVDVTNSVRPGERGERDGVDTAIELYRDLGIRSIFATAHADPVTKSRANAASPLAWLQKPFMPRALISTVRTALEGQ